MFKNYLNEVFYLDLRSLALFRIGLGLISLYNLYCLYPQIDAFLGPHGIDPLSSRSRICWSFYALSDNYYFILFLFALHALFAFMLIVGYQTRLAAIFCFIMTVALVNRMPMVAIGGDKALKVFLMWGAFLPLGEHFSIDKIKGRGQGFNNSFVSLAVFAFICQMLVIYISAAIAKDHPIWVKNHTALYYIFSNHEFVKPLAVGLLQHPELLKSLTFLSLMLEYFGSLLLLAPIFPSLFRGLAVIVFIIFHLGIYLTMDVGYLSAVLIVAWIALIPSSWWRMSKVPQKRIQPSMLRFNNRSDWAIVLILIYILTLNFRLVQTNALHKHWQENRLDKLCRNIGIYQTWNTFAPNPPLTTRKYFFVPGDQSSPIEIAGDSRWKKMLFNFRDQKFKRYYPSLNSYLIYRWNKEHPENQKISTAHIFYREKLIFPDGKKTLIN